MEDNKLIANFHLVSLLDAYGNNTGDAWYDINNNDIWIEDLKYHESWDALMPVVEKIETTLWDISNYQSAYDKRHNRTESTGEIFVSYDERLEFKGWVSMCGIDLGRQITCFEGRESSKIIATYKAVVKFIEWHNDQKN